jgi:hypothetical protein
MFSLFLRGLVYDLRPRIKLKGPGYIMLLFLDILTVHETLIYRRIWIDKYGDYHQI